MLLIILGLILASIGIIWLTFKIAFAIISRLIKFVIYAGGFLIVLTIWLLVFPFLC